ncbi:NB-ARC domain-containing protein, partial [Nostoc sp.]
MDNRDHLGNILDRILNGSQTEEDIAQLRRSLKIVDGMLQIVSQDGKFNTNIGQITGADIHIGDRVYQQWDEEAIEALVKALSPSSIGIPQNIPHTGVIKFVGRTHELQLLHQKLQEKNCVAISAIAGMGGVGKTELAIKYALDHQKDYSGGICWLRAKDKNIGEQIVNFTQNHLGLKIPDYIKGLDNQVSWCWQHWQEGNVLIVLDDVTNYAHIKSYLPFANPRFRVLITTRLELLKFNQRVELNVLEPDTALILLEFCISNKERIQNEYTIAQKICKFLGYLPLGLELVGRYLEHKSNLSLAEMLQRLEAKGLKEQALKKPEKLTLDMTAELGVAAAFDLSWQELNSTAKELSLFLCLFDLVPISWQLVEQCFPEQDTEN